jgi:hypothetical protein
MTPFTEADIVAAASQASIPPALLMGMVRSAGTSGSLNLPDASIQAYGITNAEIQKDPNLLLTLAAKTLADQFKKTGDWESALSKTLTGDANSSQAETTSVGGMVQQIIGWAATQPTYGMEGYQPTNPDAFTAMAQGLGTQFSDLVNLGGVMTNDAVKQYHAKWQGVAQTLRGFGNVPFRAAPSIAQAMTDVMKEAKIPVTQANLAFLETMARGEGMDPQSFNWLATTSQAAPSVGTVPNTPGVQIYGSYQDGVMATAQTLLNGNYNRMIQLMRSSADLHTLASDPQVQRDLEKWQGGSTEDVRNLLHLANIPGKPIQQADPSKGQQAKETAASPDEVGQFASQLQAHNIDPSHFIDTFPWLAAQRRRLTQEKETGIGDFAEVAGMTKAQMLEHLLAQPHSKYPGLSVAAMEKARGMAELFSVQHMKAMPSDAVVARMAQSGASWNDVNNYYRQESLIKAQGAGQQPSTAQPGGGKVVPMPGHEQQRQQGAA